MTEHHCCEGCEVHPDATVMLGDSTWHDGVGWYYICTEYPDEGSCGAFTTFEEAAAHAIEAGYRIANALVGLVTQ